MVPFLSLYLVLTSAAALPAPPPPAAAVKSRGIVQTIRTTETGKVEVDSQATEAGGSTIQFVEPGGRTVRISSPAVKRILIQLNAPPVLDQDHPGVVAETSAQRQQLRNDLAALDERLKPSTLSRVTREYQTLFSGVAATVDAASIAEIRLLPNVAAVHDDVEMRAQLTESVPLIGATAVAATYGVTGAGVKVAVIDSGIDYTHPDLGGCFGAGCRVVGGYDFVNDDADPRDDDGHGTHVAGIIAANGTLKGVAPGATLLAYKVLDSTGYGYSSDIIAALEQAVLDGAKVANLSLGGSGYPGDPTSQAVDNATSAGMLSVVAAGNSGPLYRSIASPGVASTALTVGATDKSWQMAYFSSRGYVVDGDAYVMKPEMVAPGVDIRSTVPATGSHGNSSRYATLSGTSMATPHVAGSAALLLQWDAAQSPDDLKKRLVGSARSIQTDPFIQGAGRIDLVAAFGLGNLASATHVSFGVVDATSGVVVREETLSVRNTSASSQSLSFAATTPLPAGTTLEIIPSSAVLKTGASVEVKLRLTVDAAITPTPPEPLVWSTALAITGGGSTTSVPVYFFKGSVLTLSFDENPWYVTLVGSPGQMRTLSQFGTSVSVLVQPGPWDVLVHYVNPVTVLVREEQNVSGQLSLSFARTEATHVLTVRAVDDANVPVDPAGFMHTLALALPDFASFLSTGDDVHISEMSSRFLVGLTGGGPDASRTRFFVSSWYGQGLSSDVILPVAGVPFRKLAQSAAKPPGSTPLSLAVATGFVVKASWGAIGSLFSYTAKGEALNQTLYIQSSSFADLPIVPIVQSSVTDWDTEGQVHSIQGPYLHHQSGAEIAVDTLPWFHLHNPAPEPMALLGAAVERWDLDSAPNTLPLQFWNSSSTVQASYESDQPRWLSHTVSTIKRISGSAPSFDLYRNGALIGTYPLENWRAGISSPAGPHEVRATSGYAIGGGSGSSRVVASFDTTRSDRNPPLVSRFRIEQNGVRTATPLRPSPFTPVVSFRATDDVILTSVTLAWRQSGSATWTPLSLTKSGTDYSTSLQQGGSLDLRVIAADSAGNIFQEEWTPAIVTTAVPPPTVPTSVTATRAGAASVSVSWAASSSEAGITGYRIERLPGPQTFTTSGTGTTFVDTFSNGLVSGRAYFYRVTAVDTNNLLSTPSAYDVASLVVLADDPAVPAVTRIRGVHVAELRRAIDAIRQAAGLPSAWTSYDSAQGGVTAVDFTSLRDRLNEARTTLQLPAVQFSPSVAPGVVVRSIDVQKLRDGIK
jgi:subtilisin family serine protease